MKVTLPLLLLLFSGHILLAQRYYPAGYFSRNQVSAGIGSSAYFGDLKEEGYFASTLHFMLSLEHQLSPRLGVKAEGVYYQLEGADAQSKDAGRITRNLSFHSSNFELSSSFVLYLFRKLPVGYNNRPLINIYGQLGFGGTYFNPKADYNGNTYVLRDFKTEGVAYRRLVPLIPLGMGIRIKATDKLDITAEASYRYVFSDYLDDVSTVYPDQGRFSSETASVLSDRRQELGIKPATAGSQRGNPGVKDGYGLYTIKLSYYLESLYFRAKDRNKKWMR